MSWSIANITNTVKITDACAKDLFAAQEYEHEIWSDPSDVTYEGKLVFLKDLMEHMDYVWREHIQKVLKAHKVKGDITFGSLDGDDFGKFWGYRFDGKGGMAKLKGMIVWAAEETRTPKRRVRKA